MTPRGDRMTELRTNQTFDGIVPRWFQSSSTAPAYSGCCRMSAHPVCTTLSQRFGALQKSRFWEALSQTSIGSLSTVDALPT